MKPYAVIADLHLHSWSAFSAVLSNGQNSRLAALHAEITRCTAELAAAGGDVLYVAGDLFHVRGSIAPSVLNPTLDLFRALVDIGFDIRILPGNHDLEMKHVSRLSSAITALEGVGCTICNDVTAFSDNNVMAFPWFDDQSKLKERLEAILPAQREYIDVLLHAPIDGTLPGIPAHGISPNYLASLGFKRVFAGHYHNHKDFGNHVYSIGALSHHSWSDVGSKAGFLIVSDSDVKWFKAHTPEFVDMSAAADETEAELMAEGNFVRCRVNTSDARSVSAMREWMEKSGAAGVIIQVIKDPVKSREGGVMHSVLAGSSIESSIAAYIATLGYTNPEALQIECQKTLSEVEA